MSAPRQSTSVLHALFQMLSLTDPESAVNRFLRTRGVSRGAVALVTYLVIAFTLTHLNINGTIMDYRNFPSQFQILDKVYHFFSYSALMFLVLFVFAKPSTRQDQKSQLMSARRAITLCILVIAYGVFDEVTQPLFNRQLEAMDLLANCFGIVCGQLLFIASEVTGLRKRLMKLK